MSDIKIKSHGVRVEGDFYGKDDSKIEVKAKSKKTNNVALILKGKVDGKIEARPGSSLEKKMAKGKGIRSFFNKKEHTVSEKDYKKVAKKAFKELKKDLKDSGHDVKHMKLKIRTSK